MYYLAVWVFLVFVVNFTSSHPLQKNYGIEDEEVSVHKFVVASMRSQYLNKRGGESLPTGSYI